MSNDIGRKLSSASPGQTVPPASEGEGTEVGLHLHGRNVTDEVATQAGEAMVNLLNEIGKAKFGKNAPAWKLTGIRYICDGCGRERPGPELPADWIYAGGNDLCFECQSGRLGVPAAFSEDAP